MKRYIFSISPLTTQKNSRYDGQIAIFGQKMLQTLRDSHTFIVGCGALGCEISKMYALMGVGSITLTDDDTIAESNLPRQFFYRPSHIGTSKSATAAHSIASLNSSIAIKDYALKLDSTSTATTFTDNVWETFDIISCAVDNVTARQFMKNQCDFYSKPLLDSGTNSLAGSTQVYIPGTTNMQFGEESKFHIRASCSEKDFPYLPDHSIQRAISKFNRLFVADPEYCSMGIPKETALQSEENLENWAERIFNLFFNLEIQKIIEEHSEGKNQ